jgi:hypothetical protein
MNAHYSMFAISHPGVSAGQESVTAAEAGATLSQERRRMTSVTVFVKMRTKLLQPHEEKT